MLFYSFLHVFILFSEHYQKHAGQPYIYIYVYVAVDPLNRAFGFVASPELVGGLSARGLDLILTSMLVKHLWTVCKSTGAQFIPNSTDSLELQFSYRPRLVLRWWALKWSPPYEPLGSPLLRLLAPKGRSRRTSASTPSNARLSYCWFCGTCLATPTPSPLPQKL